MVSWVDTLEFWAYFYYSLQGAALPCSKQHFHLELMSLMALQTVQQTVKYCMVRDATWTGKDSPAGECELCNANTYNGN